MNEQTIDRGATEKTAVWSKLRAEALTLNSSSRASAPIAERPGRSGNECAQQPSRRAFT